MDSNTAEKIRRTIDSINKAKESLKRKKISYVFENRKSLELMNRENKLKEREEQLNGVRSFLTCHSYN